MTLRKQTAQSRPTVLYAYGHILTKLVGMLHDTVAGLKLKIAVMQTETYIDMAILTCRRAILERILNKCKHQHRGHHHPSVINVIHPLDMSMTVETYRLQVDIILYICSLIAQRHSLFFT